MNVDFSMADKIFINAPEALADYVYNWLSKNITKPFAIQKIIGHFDLDIVHNDEKKVLYNKLIMSQYNPSNNRIDIFLGSLKERFSERELMRQASKAFYHEAFHFFLSKKVKRFIRFDGNKNDIENAADIFAEKILIEVLI